MRILIAVDFSENSKNMLYRAVRLFGNTVDKLWLLHVAEPDPDFVGHSVDTPVMRDQVAEEFHREHGQLQEMARSLREKGIDAKALLIQGETAKTIVEQAEKLMVDLIVVGSSKHGVLHNFLLGDTIHEVLHESVRPVLMMPVH